jgi:Asp-tRNA(Asn)/Glu-tRNA(Gln) amidotransferase A subunit family amidase
MGGPHTLSIGEIGKLLRQADMGVVELARTMLDRIADLDGELNSYITVTGELALAQAATAERELRAGRDRQWL